MIMVLFGPPGCGKGTQAGIIAKDIDIPHLSTGDMLRDAVKSETETGLKAASIMEEGKLVSDEIVIDICLLYTSPSPRDGLLSRMPSSA